MPIGPQMLEDVEEPMLAHPATLRDPGTLRSNHDETAQSETLSETALVQDVRRISRTLFKWILSGKIGADSCPVCFPFLFTHRDSAEW